MAKKPAKPAKKPVKSPVKKSVVVGKKTVKKTTKKTVEPAKTKKPVRKVPIAKKPARAVTRARAKKVPARSREDVLKKQLIQSREEIVREAKTEIAKYIKGETRQLVESVLDDGDWSVIDLSEDINLKRLASHRGVLLKIDEALRKIREGTYGKCEDCGEEINTGRLKVLPFAIYCKDCQEKREELEKMEGEEL